jgi:hypothetical protein
MNQTTLISSLLSYDDDRLSNGSLFDAITFESSKIGASVLKFAYLENYEINQIRLNILDSVTTEEGVKVSKAASKEGKTFIIVDYLDIYGDKASKYFIAK